MSSMRQQGEINTLKKQVEELMKRVEKLEKKPGRPPKEVKQAA